MSISTQNAQTPKNRNASKQPQSPRKPMQGAVPASLTNVQPSVVVTLVYDRTTGALAITPIFETEANLLIHVLQGAVQQAVAMVAVEAARLRGVANQTPG